MNNLIFSSAHNGLYRTPSDVAPLRRAARDAGLAWLVIGLQRVRGKRALLAGFAREFVFPATFGGNWDALADCLQDLSWRTEPGWIVQLRDAAAFAAAAPDDDETLRGILADVAENWRGRKRVFVVLAGNADVLRPWPPR
jgi:Barstar (barnase inhibitor)